MNYLVVNKMNTLKQNIATYSSEAYTLHHNSEEHKKLVANWKKILKKLEYDYPEYII